MNKYKVLQSFSYEGEEFTAGSEVELTDEKAAAIGLSYLEKIEAGTEPVATPPAGGGSESAAGSTDTPPSNGGGESSEKGEQQTS